MSSSSSSSDDEISKTARVMRQAIRTIKMLENRCETLNMEVNLLRQSNDKWSAAYEEEVELSHGNEKGVYLAKIKELEKEVAELKSKLLKKEKERKKKTKGEASTSGTKKH